MARKVAPRPKSLSDRIASRLDLLAKLDALREWSAAQYPGEEIGPDGLRRGPEHCAHVDHNANRLLLEGTCRAALCPEEVFLLAAAVFVHDIERASSSVSHGAAARDRLLADCGHIAGVSLGEATAIADVIAVHDLQGIQLAEALPRVPPRDAPDALGGVPIDNRLLASVLKLADLLDTSEIRLGDTTPGDIPRRVQRVVRLARGCITGWRLDDGGEAAVISATPRSPADLSAVRAYVTRLARAEVEPISRVLRAYGLPERLELEERYEAKEPAVDRPERSPGLYWFSGTDEAIFRGRDALIGGLAERINTEEALPLVPIVGLSGAGKSSILAAGIIPRLGRQGWQCLHLRPGFGRGSRPVWRSAVETGQIWRSAEDVTAHLRCTHLASVDTVGALVALDQLEDLQVGGPWRPDWLLNELHAFLRDDGWLSLVLAYRAEYDVSFGPLIDQLACETGNRVPPRAYVQFLSGSEAADALRAAPEFSGVRFDPPELFDRVLRDLEAETFRETRQPGIYPPYLQIAVPAIAAAAPGQTLSEAGYDKLRGPASSPMGRIIGDYHLATLERLREDGLDPDDARRVLSCLVDVADEGRKGHASSQEIAAESGLPAGAAGALLHAMVGLRLLRAVDDTTYEPAHDYFAHLLARDLDPAERAFKFARASLKSQALNYAQVPQLLTADEQRLLYRNRSRVHPNADELLLILRTIMEEKWWSAPESLMGSLFNGVGWFWLRDRPLRSLVRRVANHREPLPRVGAGAYRALALFGDERDFERLAQGLRHGSYFDSSAALRNFASLFRQRPALLRDWAAELINSPQSMSKDGGFSVLADIAAPADVPLIERGLEGLTHYWVRERGLRVLATALRGQPEDLRSRMMAGPASGGSWPAGALFPALAEIARPADIPTIGPGLREREAAVAGWAFCALLRAVRGASAAVLQTAVDFFPLASWPARVAGFHRFCGMAIADDLPAITAGLSDHYGPVRGAACRALASALRGSPSELRERLAPYLQDRATGARAGALVALSAVAGTGDLPGIEHALAGGPPELTQAAWRPFLRVLRASPQMITERIEDLAAHVYPESVWWGSFPVLVILNERRCAESASIQYADKLLEYGVSRAAAMLDFMAYAPDPLWRNWRVLALDELREEGWPVEPE